MHITGLIRRCIDSLYKSNAIGSRTLNSHTSLNAFLCTILSSGTYGVPVDLCTRAMYQAVREFSRKYSHHHQLRDVHIVTLDEESIGMMIVVMQQLLAAAEEEDAAAGMRHGRCRA